MRNSKMIIQKEKFLKKLIKFFKIIFKKDLTNQLYLSENSSLDKNDKLLDFGIINIPFEKAEFIEDIDPIEDKKQFLQLYKDFKDGLINIKDINGVDLIRINILQRELINTHKYN